MTEKKNLPTFRYLPLSIHLETQGGIASPLILRGTPLPAKRTNTFATAEEGQKAVEIRLSMGESQLAKQNVAIGTFSVGGIPEGPRGKGITIAFQVDSTCAVTVTATVAGTQISDTKTFQPPIELSQEFISKRLQEAESRKAEEDLQVQAIEAKNKAHQLIANAEERLKLGSNDDLSRAVANLGLSLDGGDVEKIKQRSQELELKMSQNAIYGDIFADIFRNAPVANKKTAAAKKMSTERKSEEGDSIREKRSAVARGPNVQVLGQIFGSGDFALDPQLCFVLMPFQAALRPIYNDNIQPTVEKRGIRCQRADEIASVNQITRDIWERINRARFLIADLTDRNPNVFYELGLAHALSKDVILITQSMEYVPFDLQAVRCIVYQNTSRGLLEFEEKLGETIDVVMKSR